MRESCGTKNRVILVHGWASAFSGRYDIDKLAPYFEAARREVVQFDYGFHLLVSNRNDKWAVRLFQIVQPGDVICGHSNAAVLIQKMSYELYPLRAPVDVPYRCKAILINPALGRNAQFGPSLDRIDVFHTPTDIAVRIAGLLPWHPWGWAGADGIRTGDPRVTNHNMAKDYPVKVWDHLGVFHQPALDFYGPLIAGLL